MRNGLAFSAIAHLAALLVAVALLGSPKPFAPAAIEAVAVDIVSSNEVTPPKETPDAKPPTEQGPTEQKPTEESLLPTQRPTEMGADSEGQTTKPQSSPTPQASPTPQESPTPQAAAPPPQQSQVPQEAAPQPQANAMPQDIFSPSRIQELLDIAPSSSEQTPATAPGVDAPAETRADLSRDEVAQLKAHLRKCWKAPPGLESAQRMRVVVRIFLARDGALAAEPELVEAPPPTRSGPRLVEAAMRAVRQCQPFGFLPPERYEEWKILDINISPREMAGG
jgi:hypothetical protein